MDLSQSKTSCLGDSKPVKSAPLCPLVCDRISVGRDHRSGNFISVTQADAAKIKILAPIISTSWNLCHFLLNSLHSRNLGWDGIGEDHIESRNTAEETCIQFYAGV